MQMLSRFQLTYALARPCLTCSCSHTRSLSLSRSFCASISVTLFPGNLVHKIGGTTLSLTTTWSRRSRRKLRIIFLIDKRPVRRMHQRRHNSDNLDWSWSATSCSSWSASLVGPLWLPRLLPLWKHIKIEGRTRKVKFPRGPLAFLPHMAGKWRNPETVRLPDRQTDSQAGRQAGKQTMQAL